MEVKTVLGLAIRFGYGGSGLVYGLMGGRYWLSGPCSTFCFALFVHISNSISKGWFLYHMHSFLAGCPACATFLSQVGLVAD